MGLPKYRLTVSQTRLEGSRCRNGEPPACHTDWGFRAAPPLGAVTTEFVTREGRRRMTTTSRGASRAEQVLPEGDLICVGIGKPQEGDHARLFRYRGKICPMLHEA
jgi:hypothetical protein